MLKYLNQYVSDFEKELNIEIMNKEYDLPLLEYVVDAWKSMEIVENIKFLGYTWNERESQIDINRHIFKRTKKVKRKDIKDYKFIEDTRCGLLTVKLKITVNEEDPKTKELHIREKIINKDMLIPLEDDNGLFFINGRKYYMIYQLVEKSTYTTRDSNVIKSLMPITIKRTSITREDVDENTYTLPVYNTYVFRREHPIMLFIAANGLEYGLGLLHVQNVVGLVSSLENRRDDCTYFQISAKCFIEVDTEIFKKHAYVQSIVGGLLTILTNRFTLDQLSDTTSFIKKLNPANKYEKGRDTLVSFNRMLDETTKKILKLNTYNKDDPYVLLRWCMMNFNELKAKDNLSLENKRLRCNEVISSLLTHEFSIRLNRIISLGSKATMENILDIFKFPGDILITKMHQSGVLRFDENINDMTFFTKFKWTKCLSQNRAICWKNLSNCGNILAASVY